MSLALSNILTIDDLEASQFQGKRVLIRVDFNVPQDKQTLAITNPARILAALPTIKHALTNGAKVVILMSHLGRPDGKANAKYSLEPVLEVLKKELSLDSDKAFFAKDCVGPPAKDVIASAPQGSVVLLENLRFHPEEEGKGVSPEDKKNFEDGLTELGDLYINDAFGTAHRAHASMVGVNLHPRAAGKLMAKELEYFAKALETPRRPFLAILGGAKVSDKIKLIESMVEKVDKLIICGGMAFTFKKEANVPIGNSLFDEAGAKSIREGGLRQILEKHKDKFVFPKDYVVSPRFDVTNASELEIKADDPGISDGFMGLDAGPESRKLFREEILKANTILWNGPPGVFENDLLAEGSKAMLEACRDAVRKEGEEKAAVIVGGGDTATVVEKFKNYGNPIELSHVSTGGGASLELLEGKVLPGVKALDPKN